VTNAAGTAIINWEDDAIQRVLDGMGDDTILGTAMADSVDLGITQNDADTVFAKGGDDTTFSNE
jgi:hypothetical protein